MNSDGFKSVSLLDTLSGAENDETQGSTHASEKPRKNESARKKKVQRSIVEKCQRKAILSIFL